MAIAYETSGNGQLGAPATTGTLSVNVGSSTDRILWVCVFSDFTSDQVTAITYNGVAMTPVVGRRLNTAVQYIKLYYLLNPTAGANTLSVTVSSSNYFSCTWAVYSGVPSSTGVVGTNTDSQDVASGTMTLSLTTEYDNAWLISAVRSTDTGSQTPGTGSTERTQYGTSLGDSNGVKSPTGSYSMAWAADPSGKIGGIMAHFAASSGGGGATFTPRVSFFM